MAVSGSQINVLNPVARAILQGLYDNDSPLHLLLGMHYILKTIWNDVVAYWKSYIRLSDDSDLSYVRIKWGYHQTSSDLNWIVRFPLPCNLNINMMPFVMEKQFNHTKLPEYLRSYWEQLIKQCIMKCDVGKIGYLTIQESFVAEGSSQRRPGIHTESPGVGLLKHSKGEAEHFPAFDRGFWGHGVAKCDLKLEGGIYMASNVEDSCQVWNCQILRPEGNYPDVVGRHGNIEHLREFLPPSSEVMAAHTLYWITDRTPHEALPVKEGTYRQFFRLVTSEVSFWFEDHSTKNPQGVVPDPKKTKILCFPTGEISFSTEEINHCAFFRERRLREILFIAKITAYYVVHFIKNLANCFITGAGVAG